MRRFALSSGSSFAMTKPIKRFPGPRPVGRHLPLGNYHHGLKNESVAAELGYAIAYWVHVEDMMVSVLQDLLGSKRSPARQIFHSLISNKVRRQLMTACLEKAELNARKTDIYEIIITRFSDINDKRNKLIHGMWFTHESGRVFLSESAMDDTHFGDAREVEAGELKDMVRQMTILASVINSRRSPTLARIIASPDIPPPQPARRNKKAYRQSKTAKPKPLP
jgi:hypothetical protein